MCGFVGIINKNQTAPELSVIKTMADTIHHRGPDGEGYFIKNNLAFYHKRLSIIDIKGGAQPMISGNLTIVYNGEVYNYLELREELVKKGHQFKSKSDTEVILKMYEEYGPRCVNQLNGMFSFLLYDSDRNQVLVARDHFGIKPLYYYEDENNLIFASEIKAILKHPSFKKSVNYVALKEYLTFQFILHDDTLFENIYKVSPGHYLTIDLHDFKKTRVKYWIPDFSIDGFHNEEYFMYELNRLIHDAIRIQLRSDVPVGTYLSGGLDSSLVTTIAASLMQNQISTFSGGFKEGPEFDETAYAKILATSVNAKDNYIFPTATDFIDLLPKIIYHLDEPVAGPGAFPQFMVSKLASENVTVVLGGQGGDEIFGGYARYVVAYLEQALKGSINETSEEGEHIVTLKSILPNLPYLRQYQPMMKKFWSTEVFEAMDRRYFYLIDRMNGDSDIYDNDFISFDNKEETFHRFQQLFNDPNTKSYYNKMTHFDMFGSLPALLQVEDRMSMASSIESRVPLLDRRIVDLVASIPPKMKFAGGEMKYILKKTIGKYLPPEIINRKDKMGFPVPLHLWAKNEAREFIHDTLLSGSSKARKIYNYKKLQNLIDSERPFGRQIWGTICLELWFQTFIDN
jgi:asparagine synthase (glutamine-hydrolysing)